MLTGTRVVSYTSDNITEEPDAVVPHGPDLCGGGLVTGRSTTTASVISARLFKIYFE